MGLKMKALLKYNAVRREVLTKEKVSALSLSPRRPPVSPMSFVKPTRLRKFWIYRDKVDNIELLLTVSL